MAAHLTLFCDCPYYDEVGGCKHIWATILAADAQNYFTAITRLNPQRHLVRRIAPRGGRRGFDQPHYYARPAPHSPSSSRSSQVAPPAWQQRLNEIVPAGSLASTAWPAQRELLYIVDVPASVSRGALVLI